jgi:hypothetical protein
MNTGTFEVSTAELENLGVELSWISGGISEEQRKSAIKNSRLVASAKSMYDALQETDKDLTVLLSNVVRLANLSNWEESIAMHDLIKSLRARNRNAMPKTDMGLTNG